MDYFFQSYKLNMNFTVPGTESALLERIRKYFTEARYEELPGDGNSLKFRRFQLVKGMNGFFY
jgi:hypothetical protein